MLMRAEHGKGTLGSQSSVFSQSEAVHHLGPRAFPRGVEFIRPAHANDRQAPDQRPRSNEFDPTGTLVCVRASG